jgi:cell shape-determining protein MreC
MCVLRVGSAQEVNGKSKAIIIGIFIVLLVISFFAGRFSQRGLLVGANATISSQRRAISDGQRDIKQLELYNRSLRKIDIDNRRINGIIKSESEQLRSDLEQLRNDNEKLRRNNRGYIERQQRIEEIIKQINMDNNRG